MTIQIRQTLWRGSQARPSVDPKHRIYAVGDLHGRFDLLHKMLRCIVEDFEFNRDDRSLGIVFLGDYIDRGEQSRDVLETLKKLVGGENLSLVALRGSHEAALLDFIHSPNRHRAWLADGAQQTLAAYGVAPPHRKLSEAELIGLRDELIHAMGDHLDFLRGLPTTVQSGDVIFTHAGLAQGDGKGLLDQPPVLWGGSSSDPDWPEPNKLVVHGHYSNSDPVDRPGRICVDTGACYSGRLTAARLDESVMFLSVSN